MSKPLHSSRQFVSPFSLFPKILLVTVSLVACYWIGAQLQEGGVGGTNKTLSAVLLPFVLAGSLFGTWFYEQRGWHTVRYRGVGAFLLAFIFSIVPFAFAASMDRIPGFGSGDSFFYVLMQVLYFFGPTVIFGAVVCGFGYFTLDRLQQRLELRALGQALNGKVSTE